MVAIVVRRLRLSVAGVAIRVGSTLKMSRQRDSNLGFRGDAAHQNIPTASAQVQMAAANRRIPTFGPAVGFQFGDRLVAGRAGAGRFVALGQQSGIMSLSRQCSASATTAKGPSGGGGGGDEGQGQKEGGFGIKKVVLYGTLLCGSGAVGYLLYGGSIARREAKNTKVRWGEMRRMAEAEMGEMDSIPMSATIPRAMHLGILYLPLLSLSVPTLALTLLEGNYSIVAMTMGWAGDMLRSTWLLVLRMTLERSGAAFIKWGQWAATRPDIFPRQMCEALGSLHDQVPPHAWEHTERSIKAMYNVKDITEVFEEFSKLPIGSGSIAQVYKAKIRGGQGHGWVAVKVRHPGVERLLLTDFVLLKGLGDLLDYIPAAQWMGLKESLVQFEHTLGVQVRLDFEAANLDLFNANFRACPHVTTMFPSPTSNCPTGRSHVSDDVLVESFEAGHSVAAYCAAAAADKLALASKVARNAIKTATHANTTLVKRVSARIKHIEQDAQTAVEQVAEEEKWLATPEARGKVTPLGELQARHVVKTGKETYLQMLLVDNFIHADMHPGNIIVRLTPGEKLPTLVLIDAGMVDVMGPHEQDNFIGLFKAMGSGKGDVAAKYLLNFSARQDAADVEGFTREITSLFETKCRGFGTGVDVGEVLQGVLDALRKHRVRVDGNYATSVVNLLCIEGVASALDPSYNLLDESEALLTAHTMLGRENLAFCMAFMAPIISAARNLRASFQDLGFSRHSVFGLLRQ